jgi:hypothetical protein
MPGIWITNNEGYEYVRTSFSNPEKYAEMYEENYIKRRNAYDEYAKKHNCEILTPELYCEFLNQKN